MTCSLFWDVFWGCQKRLPKCINATMKMCSFLRSKTIVTYHIALRSTPLFLDNVTKPTYLFCSSCSEECHITDPLTHLPLLFCCVAGLYGFVPRVRLNRLRLAQSGQDGNPNAKKRSFVEMVTQVVVATQVPRYPELILFPCHCQTERGFFSCQIHALLLTCQQLCHQT